MSLYTVFDGFLARDTWYTGHILDNEAFYQALTMVVTEDGFDPDKMGDYFRTKQNPVFEDEIDRLVHSAWSVYEYIRATH